MKKNKPWVKRYKILVTPTSFKPDGPSAAMGALRNFAGELVFNPTGKPLAGHALIELLKGCDGVIAGLDDFNRDVIRACGVFDAGIERKTENGRAGGGARDYGDGRLKVISRYGSGYDNIDLAAAREHNVTVCYAPGANAESVADLAFGLMLCVARRLPMLDRTVKAGAWARSTGVELYGKTMGIIGLGAVGKGVAKRARGFSMTVLAYDNAFDRDFAETHGVTEASFEYLIASSDVISLHLPLNGNTRHIIDRKVLGAMKPGALLINTARGGLIDEGAAYEALVSGRLGGLGLDAYEDEPPKVSPLFGLDNVSLTPHAGSHTVEATAKLADMSVKNLIDVLSGSPCHNIVRADL